MTLYVVPIVEGQTEQGCLERLLQRVWRELLGQSERLQVVELFRGARDSLAHPNGEALRDTVAKAYLKLQARARRDSEARSLLLILLDAEEDCPKTLAPRLLETARKNLPADLSIACVLAKRMFENWIVAGASTLASVNELPDALPARDAFEERHGAHWLGEQLRSKNRTRKYKKTVDAEEFIIKMDLAECRGNSPSFDKLCRDLQARVVQTLPSGAGESSPPADA